MIGLQTKLASDHYSWFHNVRDTWQISCRELAGLPGCRVVGKLKNKNKHVTFCTRNNINKYFTGFLYNYIDSISVSYLQFFRAIMTLLLTFRLNACSICLICLDCKNVYGQNCTCQAREIEWKRKKPTKEKKRSVNKTFR